VISKNDAIVTDFFEKISSQRWDIKTKYDDYCLMQNIEWQNSLIRIFQ
jgi:hypothetical protein